MTIDQVPDTSPAATVHFRPTADDLGGPVVSVLIPLLNEAESVHETIAVLLDQDIDEAVEFLLIDGGSTDGTLSVIEAAAREHPSIRVLRNPARVTPAALNIGLAAARGRYVARMDGHNVYPPNYLRSGVERLRRGDVASASGPSLAEATTPWARRVALALRSWLGTGEAPYRYPIDTEIDVDSGFTGIWERRTLEAHRGWDEATYPNEDAELAARIRATGQRIVCVPEMASRYTPRDSLPALARQYWRYGQYRCRTANRQPNSMRPSHVLAPGLAAAVVAAPIGIPVVSTAAAVGIATYGAAVAGVTAAHVRSHRTDAAFLPAVFLTMHLAWGFGFLRGVARFGFPSAALAQMAADLPRRATTRRRQVR